MRADALLREHRQQQQQHAASNAAVNHHGEPKQPIGQDFGAATVRNSRPESRNRIVAYQTCARTTSNERTVDHVDAGLLAVVDQQPTPQTAADPLVSLIQSLAEISPVRSPPSVTNKSANDHPASIGPATTMTTTTTVSGNVANATSTNCSPNQSPKAWQNCTQVCPGCRAPSRGNPNSVVFTCTTFFLFFFFSFLFTFVHLHKERDIRIVYVSFRVRDDEPRCSLRTFRNSFEQILFGKDASNCRIFIRRPARNHKGGLFTIHGCSVILHTNSK